MSDELEGQGAPGQDGQGVAQQMFEGGAGAGGAPQGGEGGQGAAAPPKPTSVTLTPDAIKALAQGLAPAVQPTSQQKPAEAPPRQLSQEELNKLMNVFNATPAHAKRLGLSEEAVDALNEVLQAVVRQAVTMSYLANENLKRELTGAHTKLQEELMGQINPINTFVSQQREAALRAEFFAQNEDLKRVEPLVEAVFMKLVNSGVKLPSKEETFKLVADQTRQMLEHIAPGQGGGNEGGQNVATPARRMPTVTTGGRGGAMQGGGQASDAVARTMFG